MEFVRKKRYVRYHNPKCKTYLRIDFGFQCAYCKTSEKEVIIGEKAFEKDHFKPQLKFTDSEDVHKYENLYYSCSLCNGKSGKSDYWDESLLNPCKDNIYGEDNHIAEPDEESRDFKLRRITDRGERYIEVFNLNQKDHRIIRKKRNVLKQSNKKRVEEICELKDKVQLITDIDLKSSIINIINDLVSGLNAYPYEIVKDDDVLNFERNIKRFVESKDIYDEYDLDYELTYNNKTIKCDVHIENEVAFESGILQRRINLQQALDWTSIGTGICFIVYDSAANSIYYSNVKELLMESDLSKVNQYLTINISKADELCEGNKSKFYSQFFG